VYEPEKEDPNAPPKERSIWRDFMDGTYLSEKYTWFKAKFCGTVKHQKCFTLTP
jgi:hypothetical protein